MSKISPLPSDQFGQRNWSVNVGTSLPYGIFDKLERIVEEQHTSRAVVIRRLLLRGIAAYERDGQLDEAEEVEA